MKTKMTPAKAVLLGVPALIVMACGSGAATDDESGGEKQADSASAGDVGNWKIETKKIQFTKEFGMFKSIKLKVRNVSDSEDEPWLEIRATNEAGDLVTTFDCIGQTVDAGQATTLECTSMDDFAKVTDYEIKNAF